MSDSTPLSVFHRAAREVAGVGCVLDPWLSRRAYPCPTAPDIGLEPLDCTGNKFLELPVRFRGAVPLVPYLDLNDVRTDPWIQASRSVCANGLLIDLLAAFDRSGKACAALCGSKPYGEQPTCPALSDDMGMVMLGCYGDYDTADPGYIIPQPGSVVTSTGAGAPPRTTRPTCVAAGSSSGSSCFETCVATTAVLAYAAPCLYEVRQSVCVCGTLVTITMDDPVEVGCDCCGSSSSSESSSSSGSSASSASSTSSSSTSSASASSASSTSSSSSSSESSTPCGTQCVAPVEKTATASGMGGDADRATALAAAYANLDEMKLVGYDPQCVCMYDTPPAYKRNPMPATGEWGTVTENCYDWGGFWECFVSQTITVLCGDNRFGCCVGENTRLVAVNFASLLPSETACDPASGLPGRDLMCSLYMSGYDGKMDEACSARCISEGFASGRWNTCPFTWSVEDCGTYGYDEPICCCGSV